MGDYRMVGASGDEMAERPGRQGIHRTGGGRSRAGYARLTAASLTYLAGLSDPVMNAI